MSVQEVIALFALIAYIVIECLKLGLEDGVYVKIRGELKGFARFWIGVQVLGSMDVDVINNPNTNLDWGYFQNAYNGYVDQIIPDGYIYKN